MIETIIIKSVIFLAGICTIFSFGFFKGKKSAEIKQLKNNLKDAKKSKKRQVNRRNDNISTVKRRMQKYVRK
ncbi:MAG: hypothetical protein OEY79_01855 [Anaplasmataceae bacterium]|nr:hypothetical protein [Candidatus Heimdallarchaeota archaeon]MDH5796270.1 hypothetical protein [Anaplasmataceae bacterium]